MLFRQILDFLSEKALKPRFKVFGNNKDFLKSLFDLIPEKRSNVYVEAALVLENVSRAVTDKTIRLSEVCDLRKIMSQINKFKGKIIN